MTSATTDSVALQIRDLEVTYRQGGRNIYAVRGVTLSVQEGETVAVVGESGCGKSSTGRVVAGLRRPSSGAVLLGGTDVSGRAQSEIQMVFQHPDQSLDPRWTVEASLNEPLSRASERRSRDERRRTITAALRQVGLNESYLTRRPRQLSGGQAQRVAVARALVTHPRVLVLDEPTASLDQTVRGRLLATLKSIQEERRIAYLFITHDLASVRKIADRVVVMYLGSIVEEGPAAKILNDAEHPYTKALLRAAPSLERGNRWEFEPLPGETPSADVVPPGCPFASRCPDVVDKCRSALPKLSPIAEQHRVACFVAQERAGARSANGTPRAGLSDGMPTPDGPPSPTR